MPRPTRPDPYDGFKNDRERRLALNTRARCATLAIVAVAITGMPINWKEMLRWLMTWLR